MGTFDASATQFSRMRTGSTVGTLETQVENFLASGFCEKTARTHLCSFSADMQP